MGLLYAGYQTYETFASRAGVVCAAEKEPLAPVAHMIQKAQLEISITENGSFIKANTVAKENAATIIPVTLESSGRTSSPVAHPLCDQLAYLSNISPERHTLYCQQLSDWANSSHSHPKVRAVWKYIQHDTILRDLAEENIIKLDSNGKPEKGKIEGTDYEKCLVRWRVIGNDLGKSAVWEDESLFQTYTDYYLALLSERKQDVCMITGEPSTCCDTHPKGIVAANFGAKLISSNDSSGFTFRGRFVDASQAGSVGYLASQKAHSALRWVAANSGFTMGGRSFLCWNPTGAEVPSASLMGLQTSSTEFINYRKELEHSLVGYEDSLSGKQVVIAALDAATTGRLSVTYYNELEGSDFIRRLIRWYNSCCFPNGSFGIQSPPIWRMVNCAFGVERGERIEADERVVREHAQQMLRCIVDSSPIPYDVMRNLAIRAGMPLAYKPNNRRMINWIACAVVRKYYNDKVQKEEWKLDLDYSCRDRSYLFGRLLAVAEKVERDTYDKDEKREPNAIQMQTMFVRRPLYTWAKLEEKLIPYFRRLSLGKRAQYRALIDEIFSKFSPEDLKSNQPLKELYLLGYHLQRAQLYKKEKINDAGINEMEESENERT